MSTTAPVFGTGFLADVDLVDPATYLRPDVDDVWRFLRRESPVAWHPGGGGFWVVTPHQLVTRIYRDSGAFTSTGGNVMATLLNGGDSAGGRMLAVSDGKRHQRIRRELMTAFTPAALASVRRGVVAGTRRLVQAAVERGTVDFATEVAEHIPLAAICDLLDVPAADRDDLLAHTSSALSSDAPDGTDLQARLARNEILMYFAKLARKRRGGRADDVIGLLVGMTEPPLSLSDDEVLLNCYSLLLGGDETARLSMIGAVKALTEHPEVWDALRSGRVDQDRAVEEVLRWTTPAMHSGRTVVSPTEVGGVEMSPGQVVTIWTRSANFDETEFADPHRLDLNRSPNRHLSFAYGPHFCLGAQLARIEIGALLSALVEFADGVERAGEPQPIFSTFLSGYRSLPVRFTPRSQGSTT
ncbi:cytochrome P450 [Lentzea albida]|uniref:Cytochrome P450 n=1 Tax=Lentzea albida TaxID=65499 RepID=A0A1H9C260_9PSEU|nr:cytochrome P450 [Lentzea albida]SEP94913.1 Cytochrome P450 [Lentzea albida]